MKNIHLTKILLVYCALLFAAASHAMPIVFDFTGGGPNANSINFVDAATGVTIRARGRNISNGGTPELVTWNNNGLGVRSDDEVAGANNDGQLDSFGDNERLNFQLTNLGGYSAFELVEVKFWNLDITGQITEDFGVRFDGNNPFAGGFGNDFTPGTNPWIVADDIVDLSDRMFSNFFSILLNGNDAVADRFRISSITVRAIPEPSTAVLLFVGLFALTMIRRLKPKY